MIERLDAAGLRDLSERTDRLGVLSVYLNADPSQDANLHGVAIDLKNRFRELQRRVAEDPGFDDRRDVGTALERLWPQLEDLANPTAPGRGRVAFAALENDWILRLESAMPVATRLVLDRRPFIHPLLELLDEGRPAGVAIVTPDEARLLEWRVGSLQPVHRMEQGYVEAPHERAGQIGGGPAGQFNTPMREHRQAREFDRIQRFLDQVADVIAELADERGWERILVSGGERWTEEAISRFPQAIRAKAVADPRILSGLDDAALATAVTEQLHTQHKEHEKRLLTKVRDAVGTGVGAQGLSEVAAALNSARVAHLVYDPGVRYVGAIGADGALYGGDEIPPGGQQVTAEPRLTERLVERALETGAQITPVEGAADGALADAGGVAALLRW